MKSNNLKKLVALATSLALTATLVTGCGSSDKNNEENTSNNISSSETNNSENNKENVEKEENSKNTVDSKEDEKENDKTTETEEKKEENNKTESKPENKPDSKPESKPNTKPETKPESKPETKPEEKPESKPDPKPETKPEEKPETKPDPEPEVKLTASEIADVLVSTHYEVSLVDMSTELSTKYYMNSDLFNSYTVRMPMMMVHSDEVSVFEVKDGKMEEAKEGIMKRYDDIIATWSQYLPAQYEKAQNYRLVSNGNYLVFTIAEDSDAVVSTFNDIVDGTIDIKAVE